MVPKLTSLGHILTPPGRVEEKKDSDFKIYSFSQITLKTKKDRGIIQAPSCFSLQDASKHILLTSKGQVKNLTSGQSNMMIGLS